nr:cytochrome p450 82a3 [Quercus suber]
MGFLSPFLYSAIAGLIAIILFSHYLLKRSRVGLAKTVPIAPGAWPVIGHLPLLGGTQPPHLTLGAMADKYGPLFTIKLGLHPALVVSSWDIAKECFTINDLAVSSRPNLVAAKHMGYNYAMVGLTPHGPYWRELRKIIRLELLSTHRLNQLAYIRVSEVEMFLKGLYKLWTKEKDGSGQILVELKQWFGDLSLNVILRMIAGKRYFGVNHDVVQEREARCCQKAVRDFFHFLGLFVVSDAIPDLRWLDLGGHEKAMKRTAKEIDNILREWLEEHKRKRASGETKEQDFMDVMLSVTDGADLGGYDPDTVNKATCLNLIAGGNDTTAVDMTESFGLTNLKATSLEVLITPRLHITSIMD